MAALVGGITNLGTLVGLMAEGTTVAVIIKEYSAQVAKLLTHLILVIANAAANLF